MHAAIYILIYIYIFCSRYETQNIQPSRRSGRITAGMWGWMSASGPGELVAVDERLNSAQYVKILEEVMLPSVRAMLLPEPLPIHFVMDNSPVHTATVVTDWFLQHPEVIRIQWPAKSPDLNPIENLWAEMVKKWNSEKAKTKENLISHAFEVWEFLRNKEDEKKLCENLVKSMNDRLSKVINSNGSYTKY